MAIDRHTSCIWVRAYRNCEYSYYMDGTTLEVLELEKDLGITISKDLKVSQQCKQAYSKASRM